ncbi:MAG: ABC transporter substrate-binding protein, partial [Actinobacteria bacterium]|nr:ABC transporter substrate-binding protein [Actinomycetota bacterium]
AKPDVILAPYSGITAEQYQLLSQIAPTVAYTGAAWTTPWRDVITTVGTALGRADQATALVSTLDATLSDTAAAHPELAGKTVAAVWDAAGTFYVYRPADARVDFLLDLGLISAPSVEALANGDSSFYSTLSYEQLDKLDADIVVDYADTQEQADAFLTSSATAAIPAVHRGSVAQVVGAQYVAAVSPPTALSLTWGLDDLVAALSAASAKA